MQEEQVWVALGLAFLLGIVASNRVARHLRELKTVRVREMIHLERMAALEKGLPPPDGSDELARWLTEPVSRERGDWGARGALGAGIVLFFGGVGFVSAFRALPERLAGDLVSRDLVEIKALGSLGIIPMMIGVGLVIFYLLVRSPSIGDEDRVPGPDAVPPGGAA